MRHYLNGFCFCFCSAVQEIVTHMNEVCALSSSLIFSYLFPCLNLTISESDPDLQSCQRKKINIFLNLALEKTLAKIPLPPAQST